MSKLIEKMSKMTLEEFKEWDSLEAKMDILRKQRKVSREEAREIIKRNNQSVMNQKLMQTEKDKRLLSKNYR